MKTPVRRALLTVGGVLAWRLASELIIEHGRLKRHDRADALMTLPITGPNTARVAGRNVAVDRSETGRHDMRMARKARLDAADSLQRAARVRGSRARNSEADAGSMWPWVSLSILGVAGTLYALTNPLGDMSWVLAVGGVVLAIGSWFLSKRAAANTDAPQNRERSGS